MYLCLEFEDSYTSLASLLDMKICMYFHKANAA